MSATRWKLLRRHSYTQLRLGKIWVTRVKDPGDYRWTVWVGQTRYLPRPTFRRSWPS